MSSPTPGRGQGSKMRGTKSVRQAFGLGYLIANARQDRRDTP
jgi:hypothetical protein